MNQHQGHFGSEAVRFGRVSFDRDGSGLTWLAIKGFLLGLVTFGIYRFWYMTNLRRYFWSRTYVAGSAAEYVGRGKELFLGFLVALAILVPVYVVLFGLNFAYPPLAPYSTPISFVFLFLLGQYAMFRGRRYRATRTLWRGIRLGQDGSAFKYVGLATGWWIVTLLTLGCAFPWMRASLERYRINHTLVGGSRMHSTATGSSIALPWFLFYIVALAPVIVVSVGFVAAANFDIPMDLFIDDPTGDSDKMIFNPAYADTAIAGWGIAVLVVGSISFSLSLLLIPYYRAREVRAFLGAATLGAARLTSTLKARQFYWPYLIYFALTGAYMSVAGLVFGGAAVLIQASNVGDAAYVLVVIGLAVFYLATLLVFAVAYLRIVTAWLWHAVASTTGIVDVDALDSVLASARRPGSGLNEGLADALDVGGAIEIGF